MSRHVLVTGAAGFVGSHLIDRLLASGNAVTGFDNFTRGTRANLRVEARGREFRFAEVDVADLPALRDAAREAHARKPIDALWHLAANSDILAGVADPGIDLRDTFLTTHASLAIARELGIREFAFPSTSAIYGEHDVALSEDMGPLRPISSYGAMKLASEAAISAAVESHLHRAHVFRFPNVVGPRATHGVIYDFLGKLKRDAGDLEVLGDGSQQKPYLHVSELIDAMLFIADRSPAKLSCHNIGAEDDGATVRFIAESVIRRAAPSRGIRYTGGRQGWVGDVPKFRYSLDRLRTLGWRPRLTSEQAVLRAVDEIHAEFGA